MSSRFAFCLLFVSGSLALSQNAWSQSDPAAARVQLQQGYALKKKGKCAEAIEHFSESVRLDRQPKGLLNLADCEEKLGKFSVALTHSVEARDLASTQGANEFVKLANERIKLLETKSPRLTIRLAADAPKDTQITRDGVELGSVSIAIPLPLDAGTHVVVARTATLERRYEVEVADGQLQELEVTPIGGKELAPPERAKDEASALPPKSGSNLQTPPPAQPTSMSTTRMTGLVVGGVGVVAIGVGTALALTARSSWQEASKKCPSNTCSDAGAKQQGNAARTRANLSMIPLGLGVAAVVTGVVLYVRGGDAPQETATLLLPELEPSRAGVSLRGTF